MPRTEDLLDSVGQDAYITTLDLAKGYWQVPVAPEDQVKMAFIAPKGLFEFTTQGAPATFQQLMDKVLHGTESYTGVYLDDIMIHIQSWNEHLEQVTEVLDRLSRAGWTLKVSKCVFRTDECKYLGHKIGMGGVSPLETKVIAVRDMP